MKVNYNTMGTYWETSPHIYPVEVAAHFNFWNMSIWSSGELEYLTSAFVNFKNLPLEVSETLSVGEVIKLANLPNLTMLRLAYSQQQDIAYSGYHFSVLSALSELNITITDNA